MSSRYIVWQEEDANAGRSSVRELLGDFPEIRILRFSNPNAAIVLMDRGAELRIREEFPELSIEPDVQHRMV